jgi:chorismate mutase/prephenate dehydratase
VSAEIQDGRDRIDQIDREIVALVAERIGIARAIGAAKSRGRDALLRDVGRERAVFDRWSRHAQDQGLSVYYVGRILREVLNYSRRVQEEFLGERATGATGATQGVQRVGYQGVPNSYSFLAVQKLFACRDGVCLEPVGFRTLTAAVEALMAAEINYALLPIENTIAGSINETYRLLKEQAVTIVDEEFWHVEHCLAALPGASLDDIRIIRSHPVALQQCEIFLGKLGWASAEAYFDTAAAAESLKAADDARVAAICSEECAQALGLKILQRGVADQHHNYTRFVLVARQPENGDRRQPCKTSLHFTVRHREGALAEALNAFAQRQVSLTKLESRPQPDAPWEYVFYVDVEGHQDDPALAEALTAVRAATQDLRILGSYPRRGYELEELTGNTP